MRLLPQIPLLADGIRIHGEKTTEQLKPLHNRLVTCFQDLREKVEKHYGVITLVRCQLRKLNLAAAGANRSCRPFLSNCSHSPRGRKSSLCLSLCSCQDSPVTLNPICVSQPCLLTERKKSRVGSVVMPYILSSTLRRMSTVSTLSNASSGLSSGSASSDGHTATPSHESVCLPSPRPRPVSHVTGSSNC